VVAGTAADFDWSQGSPPEEAAFVAAEGFLLAGGRSSRMGRDKALLELGGRTMVEIGLDKLRVTCPRVSLVGNTPELGRFGVRVVPDAMTGCGPLGGIVAGLEASETEWNLFLAVDVPFVPVEVLKMLLTRSEAEGAVCVLAETLGESHPLTGLYAKAAAPLLRRELEAGRLKVKSAIQAAGLVRHLQFERDEWFRNLNTPEEFATARASGGFGC
jgi:molybdopterin-guanine dinucleotide biosynthesis protein A